MTDAERIARAFHAAAMDEAAKRGWDVGDGEWEDTGEQDREVVVASVQAMLDAGTIQEAVTARPRDESVGTKPGPDGARSKPWALFHHQFDLIRASDQVVYLRRWWLVKTPWGGIMLHRMGGPDARPTLHDHPFAFVSIVLRGGYIERRRRGRSMDVQLNRVRWLNVMRRDDAHSIRLLLRYPTWTLVFTGKHRRTWGFWEPTGVDGVYLWTRHDAFDSGHYVP